MTQSTNQTPVLSDWDRLPALSAQVGQLLTQHGQTICAAESCTGGLLLSSLTDVSGSSAYVLGGIVSYSNVVKEQLLGVQPATLMSYGAVSEQTAHEMAQGARHLLNADYALSVTGIAGPGGGTPTKPVGLVYIGLAFESGVIVKRYVWPEDRIGNKQLSVLAALHLLMTKLAPPPA